MKKILKKNLKRKVWKYKFDVVDFYYDRTKNPGDIKFPAPAFIWHLALSRRRFAGRCSKLKNSRRPRLPGRTGIKISSGTGRIEG